MGLFKNGNYYDSGKENITNTQKFVEMSKKELIENGLKIWIRDGKTGYIQHAMNGEVFPEAEHRVIHGRIVDTVVVDGASATYDNPKMVVSRSRYYTDDEGNIVWF